jgi:hypothetical protein
LAQLLNENTKELPSNLTDLYSKYTELSLGRWDVDKGLQTVKEFEALSNILPQLAEHFLDNDLDAISVVEAKEFFISYLKGRNLGLDADLLFEKLTARCEIVVLDPRNGTFRFKHKTFAEYFYAKAYLKKPMVVDGRVWDVYWATAFFFYVGLHRDCGALLKSILEIQPKSEAQRWNRLVTIPNYLLAGFASHYSVDIVTKAIDSPFAMLSRVHLVWVIQSIIRRNYSYEFFKKALPNVALRLDNNCTDRPKCSLSLFWLSIVNLELGENDCFDFLLKNYSQNVPLEIEIMIRVRADDLKHRSMIFKKFEQRLGRGLKQNPALRSQLENLWDRPIKALKPVENLGPVVKRHN